MDRPVRPAGLMRPDDRGGENNKRDLFRFVRSAPRRPALSRRREPPRRALQGASPAVPYGGPARGHVGHSASRSTGYSSRVSCLR